MTNPMTDHNANASKKVMTEDEMFAKLESVRDNICREFMTDEISDGLDEVTEKPNGDYILNGRKHA